MVRESFYVGLFFLGFGGESDERVGEAGRGRGVDYGYCFFGDGGGGGGRVFFILKFG